jgi:hypothetical protein
MEKALKIHLTKGLYNIGAIECTLVDFKEVCTGKIIDNSIVLELIPKVRIDNLKEEFCNHVLANMKNN